MNKYLFLDYNDHDFVTFLKVSKNNITKLGFPKYHQVIQDTNLFKSLQLAGSSYGIVTEFLYRIYPSPEIQPVITLIYIEDKSDLWKLDAAAKGTFIFS